MSVPETAAFSLLKQVLRGERGAPKDDESGTLLLSLLQDECDATFTADGGSVVRAFSGPRAIAMGAVPGTMLRLMKAAGLDAIHGPLSFVLGPIRAWVTPGRDKVVLRLRVTNEPSNVSAIAAEPPPCPPLAQELYVAVIECPRCRTPAERWRYRRSGELLCELCGFTFPRPAK